MSNDITTLAPQNLQEAIELAERFATTQMVPKDYRNNPDAILVAWQMGSELGLQPMQSLQNIAVINGQPSIWGDAALAIIKAHPDFEGHTEGLCKEGEADAWYGWAEVKRKGQEPVRRQFSVEDAKRAGLWNKSQTPWQTYPQRMLVLRARGWALRDQFPDALRGLRTAEEARDVPIEKDVTPVSEPQLEQIPRRQSVDQTRSVELLSQVAALQEAAQGADTGDSDPVEVPAPQEGVKSPQIDAQ